MRDSTPQDPPDDRARSSTQPVAATEASATAYRADRVDPEVFAGRFRVRKYLGSGSFGDVFLAEDSLIGGDLVAVKRLREDPRDPKFFERFQVEVRANQRLKHERIPQVRDSGRTPTGELYYTMEFIEGRSLKAILEAEGRWESERVARLAIQLLEVLQYAHAKGVVHRDLKPGNLMVTDSPSGEQVHVLDFGIAKILSPGSSANPGDSLARGFGTPEYMAPEQFLGEEIDGRADVFALGVLLYQAACGWLPFYGENLQAMAASRLSNPPREIAPGHVAEWLTPLLARLLARNPSERPTARDALDSFRALGAAGTISMPAPLLRLRRLWFGVPPWAAVVVVLTPILGIAWWGATRPTKLSPRIANSDLPPSFVVPIPVAASIELPPAGSLHGKGPVRVSGTAAGTRTVSILGRSVDVDGSGRWRVDLDDLPEGLVSIPVRAPGDDPEQVRAELQIVVDRTPPSLKWMALPGIDEGNFRLSATTSVTLELESTDVGLAGLETVRIGGSKREINASGLASAQLELATDGRGEATVVAEAVDRAGNSNTLQLAWRVDGTPPVITIVHPNSSERAQIPRGGEVLFEGRVVDDHPSAQVTVDGRLVALAGGVFTTEVLLDEPEKVIVITATDRAGNTSLEKEVKVVARVESALDVQRAQEEDRDRSTSGPPTPRLQWTPPLEGLLLPPMADNIVVVGLADMDLESVIVNGMPAAIDGRKFTCRVSLEGDGQTFQVLAVPKATNGAAGSPLEGAVKRRPVRVPEGCEVDGPRAIDPESEFARRIVHKRTGIVLVVVPGVTRPGTKAVYIAETETTNATWWRWKEEGRGEKSPASLPPTLPLTAIPFQDAKQFCLAVGLELPTREQWLSAARTEPTQPYSWGREWRANCANSGGILTSAATVGSYACDRSHCGAFDMTGNVSEWCQGSSEKGELVGGSWSSTPETATFDHPRTPSPKSLYVGFRTCLLVN